MLQIVACAPSEDKALTRALTTFLGDGNLLLAIQILSRQRIGFEHILSRALEHYFATFTTCLRTNIDDIVSIEHHLLIVLYDDDGVAQVAQLLQ